MTRPSFGFVFLVAGLLAAFAGQHSRAADQFDVSKIDASAAGMNAERLARIKPRMQHFVDEGTVSGIVTLVARHGHVASVETVGYQDLETKKPMQADTLFAIMSNTKPMTSAALMILVDEGKIALLDPVEKYLPEFKGQKVASGGAETAGFYNQTVSPQRPINIRDVMTHTSGLRGSAPKDKKYKSLEEMIKAGAKETLLFEPGTRWSYSSYGTGVLGRIIEVVSGQSYEQFMSERLFKPLGMTDTTFFEPADKKDRIAAVYTQDDDGKLKPKAADLYPRDPVVPSPGGGLYSTAADVARFHQMMLSGGILNGKRVLSKAAIETMTTNQTGDMKVGWAPGLGFGLGVAVVKEPLGATRYSSIGSYGHAGAYRTYAWVDPSKDLVGVILFQRTNGSDHADEINDFMQLCAAAIDD